MNNEFDLVEPVDPSKSSILNPRIPNDINRKATKKMICFQEIIEVERVQNYCHTRPHLDNANTTRLAMSLQKNTFSEVVRHKRRQDLIRMLTSLPDPIRGALQGLSM
jgi:hypothetical protein